MNLHLLEENECPISVLSVPTLKQQRDFSGSEIAQLLEYSAIALFVQRAQMVNPNFALNADNATSISEICTKLGGLPLAIILAAARIKIFSSVKLLTRLNKDFLLLSDGPKTSQVAKRQYGIP